MKRLLPAIALLFLALATLSHAAPNAPRNTPTPPATKPAAEDVNGPTFGQNPEYVKLTRKSMEQLQAKKWDEAEATLEQLIKQFPDSVTNLYNMACVQALKSRSEPAMDYLEKAIQAGYTDFAHMERDNDLDSLRDTARYKALVARKEEIRKEAVQRTLARLKKRFGENYMYEVDEQDKLIFATNTDASTLEALKHALIKQARAQWKQIFDHQPDEYIAVVLPTPGDYRRIVPNPGVLGFYNHENRTLISNTLGTVMTHEFTHALHCGDFGHLGQDHPIWLMEGMAVLWESSSFENGLLVPRDNFRFPNVQNLARKMQHVPFDKMLKMPQDQFTKNANLCYGQSGAMLYWLHEQKLLKKFYNTFKATYEKDKTGGLALEQTLGKNLKQIEADWVRWTVKHAAAPVAMGRDHGAMGIIFAQAEDGIRIDQVMNNSPAAKAGLKVNDLLLAIDETEPKDANSVLPMLKNYRPGEVIKLKLKRGDEEIEVELTLAPR